MHANPAGIGGRNYGEDTTELTWNSGTDKNPPLTNEEAQKWGVDLSTGPKKDSSNMPYTHDYQPGVGRAVVIIRQCLASEILIVIDGDGQRTRVENSEPNR